MYIVTIDARYYLYVLEVHNIGELVTSDIKDENNQPIIIGYDFGRANSRILNHLLI
jgi:hypothetical protein